MKKPLAILAVTAALIPACLSASSQKVAAPDDAAIWAQEGLDYYDDEDYASAVQMFEKAAGKGHIGAQAMLGAIYYYGVGRAADYYKAHIYLKPAAESGDAGAQRLLGQMYRDGDYVEQSDAKALEWLEKSANGGDTRAQVLIGDIYLKGKGAEVDRAKAFYWFTRANENDKTLDSILEYLTVQMDNEESRKAYKFINEWKAEK